MESHPVFRRPRIHTVGRTCPDLCPTRPGKGAYSERLVVALTSTNTHRLQQVIDENLAVTDLAGIGRLADGLDHPFHVLVGGGDLQLYLRQEVDLVLGPPV